MAQYYERTLTLLGNVHPDSIRFDKAVTYLVHWRSRERGCTPYDTMYAAQRVSHLLVWSIAEHPSGEENG
jgi:hypothetical protein